MTDWKSYSEMPPMDTPLEISTEHGIVCAVQTGPMADLINTKSGQKVRELIFGWRIARSSN